MQFLTMEPRSKDIIAGVYWSKFQYDNENIVGFVEANSIFFASNLEWVCGYGPRFGVTYIDKENGFKRIPKNSAKVVENIWKHVVSEK